MMSVTSQLKEGRRDVKVGRRDDKGKILTRMRRGDRGDTESYGQSKSSNLELIYSAYSSMSEEQAD
jgi:hypothetical protein